MKKHLRVEVRIILLWLIIEVEHCLLKWAQFYIIVEYPKWLLLISVSIAVENETDLWSNILPKSQLSNTLQFEYFLRIYSAHFIDKFNSVKHEFLMWRTCQKKLEWFNFLLIWYFRKIAKYVSLKNEWINIFFKQLTFTILNLYNLLVKRYVNLFSIKLIFHP